MEEEIYMEEDNDMDFDEMEFDEMESPNMEYREGEDYESRRFRHHHPYRYTCPQRIHRC